YALVGAAFYIMLSVTLLVGALVLHNTARTTERLLVLTAPAPLFAPMQIAGLLAAVYVAVAAAALLGRERDRGTIDVLLAGPANEGAIILGTYAAFMRLATIALFGVLAWTLAAALALNLAVGWQLLWLALLLFLAAAMLIALGLLAACTGGRTRTALALFMVVVGLLAAIQLSDQIVTLALAQGSSDSLLLINRALGVVNGTLRWVSPFGMVVDGSESLVNQQVWRFAGACLRLVLLTIAALAGALVVLRSKRGAG
ncbi:MAG: ABC transporter permease subunit, partial [Caldilineaceae bacterium]